MDMDGRGLDVRVSAYRIAQQRRGRARWITVTTVQRIVPLAYVELAEAIASGVFPAERYWIDFKRELYPSPAPAGTPSKPKSRNEVHDELARDLASFAVRGGYLVFGVEEDKTNHVFRICDMPLPAQLDQTIDQVARDRITPPLYVAPTLLTNPDAPPGGLMVVEIPESPDAPHMVGGVYYGRSETGKVKLTDDEVERLILRRSRTAERLTTAMADTVKAVSEVTSFGACRLYLTAVPTQGWPDMLLRYTRDQGTRSAFVAESAPWANTAANESGRPADSAPGFGALLHSRRTRRTRGAWFQTFPPEGDSPMRRQCVGLDDDGTVRFVDLFAGSQDNGMHPVAALWQQAGASASALHNGPVVYDEVVWWDTMDTLMLVGELSSTCEYHGAWLLGVTIDGALGRSSASASAFGSVSSRSDSNELAATSRATSAELRDAPRTVAERLLRPVLRELGSEHSLRRWNPQS
jgi:hypothetical protein